MDEQFTGPVCGLHRYTDECGVEYLLVADETGIFVRQPFAVRVFENSDAYPFDSFTGDGSVDPDRWRNREGYNRIDGALRVTAGGLDPMVWFKEATSLSYQTRIKWFFDRDLDVDQTFALIIKAADSTAQAARLELRMTIDAPTAAVLLQLIFVNSALSENVLISVSGGQGTTGFLTVTYLQGLRVAGMEYFPEGGVSQVVQQGAALTAAQDSDLGQFSALRMDGVGTTARTLVIDGGPI